MKTYKAMNAFQEEHVANSISQAKLTIESAFLAETYCNTSEKKTCIEGINKSMINQIELILPNMPAHAKLSDLLTNFVSELNKHNLTEADLTLERLHELWNLSPFWDIHQDYKLIKAIQITVPLPEYTLPYALHRIEPQHRWCIRSPMNRVIRKLETIITLYGMCIVGGSKNEDTLGLEIIASPDSCIIDGYERSRSAFVYFRDELHNSNCHHIILHTMIERMGHHAKKLEAHNGIGTAKHSTGHLDEHIAYKKTVIGAFHNKQKYMELGRDLLLQHYQQLAFDLTAIKKATSEREHIILVLKQMEHFHGEAQKCRRLENHMNKQCMETIITQLQQFQIKIATESGTVSKPF